MPQSLMAGSAVATITPEEPLHLFGYPHVRRISTGVHDPLLAAALFLSDGTTKLLVIATDVIYVPKDLVARVRRRIVEATRVPADHVLVSATHTHSGPSTVCCLSSADDAAVPAPAPSYLARLEDGMVAAARRAADSACAAELGLAVATATELGTNRHDPHGPSDPEIPVLAVRARHGGPLIAVVLVCSMHPTVLHEDSTLVSGDFPGLARARLQQRGLGRRSALLHLTGAAGNQSPRHVVRGNTVAEAERLGDHLARAVHRALAQLSYRHDVSLDCQTDTVDLPLRSLPSVAVAASRLDQAEHRFNHLRRANAARTEVRTAECDLFGAREMLTLARAAKTGHVQRAAAACLPAEIQLLGIGPWRFVAWPGEVFVEFALEIKAQSPDTYVITLANGELQGYLVTAEAVAQGWYEASNALFQSPESGRLLVEKTQRLLNRAR